MKPSDPVRYDPGAKKWLLAQRMVRTCAHHGVERLKARLAGNHPTLEQCDRLAEEIKPRAEAAFLKWWSKQLEAMIPLIRYSQPIPDDMQAFDAAMAAAGREAADAVTLEATP